MDKTQINPFKGLRPFTTAESNELFGRDRDLDLIQARLSFGKTTLLFAGSGVGKTSFLSAKLTPEIESKGVQVVYHGQWAKDEPLPALRCTLQNALVDSEITYQRDSESCLSKFFVQADKSQIILLLDHFEELFQNHAWKPCLEIFLKELCKVINTDALKVRVLLSMREEFLGEMSVFDNRIPDLFNNYYRLKHPNKTEAAEIIRKTCDLASVEVEENGLNQLITDLSVVERPSSQLVTSTDGSSPAGSSSNDSSSDVSSPADSSPQLQPRLYRDFIFLPYLQIVCWRLWNEYSLLSHEKYFLANYKSGQAANVLKTFCRDKLASIDEEQKSIVAASLEYLVNPQGAKVPCKLRNLAKLIGEPDTEVEMALNRLADQEARFLRITRGAEDSKSVWYELYHDLFAPILNAWKREYEAELDDQRKDRERRLLEEADLFTRTVVSMFKGSSGQELAASLSTLASLVERQGNIEEAVSLLNGLRTVQEDYPKDSSPVATASTLFRLAKLTESPNKAERLLSQALNIQESALGGEHTEVASTLVEMSRLIRRQQGNEPAEPQLRRALEILEKELGTGDLKVVALRNELIDLLRTVGKTKEANDLLHLPINSPRDDSLDMWIRRKAYNLSQDRKFRRLHVPIDELLRQAPSSPDADLRDWHDATVLLAVEVLDGRIDFAHQIDPSSYWRFEKECWLQDAKNSVAYKLWMERKGGMDSQSAIKDYIKANERVRKRLLDPMIKASIDEFSPVIRYLNQRYLTKGKLDKYKRETIALLNAKAYRFWIAEGRGETENWNRAVRYSEMFYGNIIQAVTEKSIKHVHAVLNALDIRRGAERADIAVNCFEIALAIYFLDPKTIAKALLDKKS